LHSAIHQRRSADENLCVAACWQKIAALPSFAPIGETPPVPPGKSPFHIRGTGYLGHLDWVDSEFPGGRAAFLALLSPPMRAFFAQTFLAISMFDFLPLASAGRVCARALGMNFVDFIEMRGRHQAQLDIGGVYRMLLKMTSPRLVAMKLPSVMSKYFDFGAVRIVSDEARCVRFEMESVPHILVDWFFGCYTGYVEVVLGAAGGHIPTLDIETAPAPDLKGFAACKLVGSVRWG
jgi:hypothetical protein